MTMALDASQQRFGAGLNFDYQSHAQAPSFSNPWSSSSPPAPHPAPHAPSAMYMGAQPQPSMNAAALLQSKPPPPIPRASTGSVSSMGSYGSLPVGASADLMSMARMQTTTASYADATYATSASPVNGHFLPPATGPYDAVGYAAAPAPGRPHAYSLGGHDDRRFQQ